MSACRLSLLALVPVALIAPPAHAATYLTLAQAQALMFPGETLTPAFQALNSTQVAAIRKASGVSPLNRQLKAWRATRGGWLIVDQVVGKHEFITFAVALDASGAVRSVEIMDYRESYGDQVRNPKWRAQFVGKRNGAALQLDKDIKNISGATLSCRHVTDGVKRLLATYAIVLAG
ncbi:FMN-binding protein [Sphingobium sp. 22B]|jgi:Na+-translocating ferredoxin:NAD+ oxidoreductase RnfG subunit|uniref:FMN-binding protein n=1 Tax=unclassified Sphingobium TaxID=2611147 RepID=UPI000784FF86|nr:MULTISPECIES: FMN-binding protein [unclassified Sphingobium]KXU32307.1 FMN-binding protein [Sphingobium sp. AM]KYC32199.1 FMN-binding protein [Sphingobium sp. 22B]OAP31831.1 FMN-binding protein [Sphingobium sp. 20006FA]